MTTAEYLDLLTASVPPLLRPAPLIRRRDGNGFETLLDMSVIGAAIPQKNPAKR